MDRKGFSGVLAAVLLVSVASGVYDAPSVLKLRILLPEGKGKEKPKTGQDAPSPSPFPPVKGNPSNSSLKPPKPDQSQTAAGNSDPGSLKSPKASGSPSNPALPSGSPSNPSPASGSPSNPSPSSGSPSNPSPESGSPLNPAPASGSPLKPAPASGSPSNPPPASGSPSNPVPVSGTPSNPVPSESGSKTSHDSRSGDDGKRNENKKENKSPSGSGDSQGKGQEIEKCLTVTSESSIRCQDKGKLVACLQHPQTESKELFLLVQNEGENPLTVDVSVPSTIKIDVKKLHLPKHNSEKIEVTSNATDKLRIVLNAGNGDCVLQMPPSIYGGNFFQQLPNYATRVTPIYGAYVLFLTAVIAGGTWACCKFGKKGRRVNAGVPYQQLEMGTQQQSGPAVGESAADGWDQAWNDDWDEEEAVARPSEKQAGGNISGNGVASRSRSTDKISWEDWDD